MKKIFLIGFMGSGKTHWGKLLSTEMQLPFVDLDLAISEREKLDIPGIFAEKGEEYFRYREKEMLEELVTAKENFILSCGGGAPCFFNNIELMKKNGTVIWLNTSIGLLQERLLKERLSRPLIRKIGEHDLRNYIIRKLGERKMYYEQADVMVNEDDLSLEKLGELITHP